FFSSRRRHTRWPRDWSSDVCSSDLNKPYSDATAEKIDMEVKKIIDNAFDRTKRLLMDHREHLEIIAKELLEKEILFQTDLERLRSEERRVGKECRVGWWREE